MANPVSRDAQSSVLFDVTGQVRLRHADQEIRLAQDPFPLYPGEQLEKVPCLLSSLEPDSACSVATPVGRAEEVAMDSHQGQRRLTVPPF